jgi:ubiquinone biosynthesis protein COQ9
VHYHLYTKRQSLSSHAPAVSADVKGVGATVKELTWRRLLANQDVIHRWQEALALMAMPSNVPPSLRELHALSDEIWYLSGDTSVDSSWYTKRASLSSIYAATELFMTMDKSIGFEETRAFMERRFEGNRALGQALGSVGQWVGFTAGAAVNVLRSKGVRI